MIPETISPAVVVLAPVAAALAAPWICQVVPGKRAGVVLAVVPAAVFAYFLAVAGQTGNGSTPWRGSLPWMPGLGIDWDLWISPLGLILGLLVAGLGALITVYAGAYLVNSPKKERFFSAFFVFMTAMLGIAVTENLLVLFVFWELTSVTSYLLIGFYHEKEESRLSARDALLVTGAGGVALLAGLILLGEAGGSYRIGELTDRGADIISHPLYPAIFLCVFAGAITKSAQFPLHFWLPGAMAAPAPVSAYLHSATMVKAGVFLLAILHPVLGGTPLWHFSLLGVGAVTMTWAALVAVAQTDLKKLLAFTTLSTLGTLTMLLGGETALGAKAAVLLLIVHAMYKGALFLVAGILEKTTGTRDVTQLGGLARSMPALAVSAALAAASMSGLPPFVGFIAKELLYEVQLEAPLVGWPLLVCGIVAGAANLVVALKVGVTPFFGSRDAAEGAVKHAGRLLWLGPALLGTGSLVLGIFPDRFLGGLVGAAVGQIRVEDIEVKLALWHGFNLVLLLSVVTVLAGTATFLLRRPIRKLAARIGRAGVPGGQTVFRRGFDGFLRAAGGLTSVLQSGRLRTYLAAILAVAAAWLGWFAARSGHDWKAFSAGPLRFDALVLTGLVAMSAWGATAAPRRMTAILCLGCAGFGLAGLFALFGAPDLAITQVLVETLTLVLFALAIYGLPALIRRRGAGRAWTVARTGIAVSLGVVFTFLTLKALELELGEPAAHEIARRSVPDGHGRNVVNVVLVDFRALDTLGESAVLAIAALGVVAMLAGTGVGAETGRAVNRSPSAVLLASARFTAPAMAVFSVYLLLRGHNEPGGGFIGGLVAAMAAILLHLARQDRSLRLGGLKPAQLIPLGLGLALLSGLPGLAVGDGFLDAVWGPEFPLPPVGKVKLGTPLLFDTGVYAVVAGVVLTLFGAMSRASLARRPHPSSLPPEPWN